MKLWVGSGLQANQSGQQNSSRLIRRHVLLLVLDSLFVFGTALAQKIKRHRTRSTMHRLTAEQLEDAGITPEQCKREMAKWVWQD